MRQGEIRLRLDAGPHGKAPLLVLSGPSYNSAPHGRVIACRIIPGGPQADFPGAHRVSWRTEDGTTALGTALPDLLATYPHSGLSEPVGLVKDMRPILGIVHALFT